MLNFLAWARSKCRLQVFRGLLWGWQVLHQRISLWIEKATRKTKVKKTKKLYQQVKSNHCIGWKVDRLFAVEIQ